MSLLKVVYFPVPKSTHIHWEYKYSEICRSFASEG